MDRKAWIIVSLCVVGIVLNTWYGATHAPQHKDEPAATQEVAKDASSPQPGAPAPTPANPAATPGGPNTPVPADAPEELVEIKKGEGANAVTFVLSSHGGGIAKAHM